MKLIKQIIREELQRVLAMISETDFYADTDYNQVDIQDNPKEDIIYDYQKGKVFGEDNLAVDIAFLNRYNLVEYLPKNSNEEIWTFEFETVRGTTLIIDIKRLVQSGVSIWKLSFGQLYKGETMPTLLDETQPIDNYNNFIASVNNKMASKIDPSKY